MISLISCKKNIDDKTIIEINKTKTITDNVKSKTKLIDLFKTKVINDTLEHGVISNVDIINGFRSVKLRLKLDSISYNEWDVNNDLEKYGVIKLESPRNKKSKYLSIFGDVYIDLTFYKGELHKILFQNYNYENLLELSKISDVLVNTYGEPNFINGKSNKKSDSKSSDNKADWVFVDLYESFDNTYEKKWLAEKNTIIQKIIHRNHLFDNEGYKNWREFNLVYKSNQIDDIEADVEKLKSKDDNKLKNELKKKSMNDI